MKMDDFSPKPKKHINWVAVSKEILEWVLCIVIAYVIYLNINFFLGTVSGVKQVSMYPTAKEGEKLLIRRPTIFKKTLERGDIVTFEAPIDKGYETEEQENPIAEYNEYKGFNSFLYNFIGIGKISYVKRVIGIAGDHIVINDDGEVYLNDVKLDEQYLFEQNESNVGYFKDVVVPKGYVFVMGDNRRESKDSRYFGCIPIEHIDGYVVCRIWPLNKMGKLDK